MTKHKVAALTVLFHSYTLKSSRTGEYYIFDVTTKEGEADICRMDAIHRRACEKLFESLDKHEKVIAPVIRDVKYGYRIDLTAIREFFQEREPEPRPDPVYSIPVELPSRGEPPVKTYNPALEADRARRVRAQFWIEKGKLEDLEALAKAEGYDTYTDWIRARVDLALNSRRAA